MKTFHFACDATETIDGRAYFRVDARSEREARKKLVEASADYFTDFKEGSGNTDWEASKAQDWEAL